jgi:hypothetical protein
MRRRRWILGMLVMLTLLAGCGAHDPVVYRVKPILRPPPLRPTFTSPLSDAEALWILDVVRWGEIHCAEIAALRGDDPRVCRVE